MNTIKYRQWLKYGRFHYWGYLKDDVFVAPCGPNDAAAPSEKFTGLYDKNGVEIYEGDVVEYTLTGYYRHSKKRGVMQWSDKMGKWHFGYGGGSSTPKHSYNFNTITGIEVIGNIHENPELLEAPDA